LIEGFNNYQSLFGVSIIGIQFGIYIRLNAPPGQHGHSGLTGT